MVSNKSITKREDGTTILVVCPTRELCIQAQTEAMRCLKRLPFIVTGCLVGGEQTNHEKSRIRKGIPLLFSTPGRLLYHLQNTESFKLGGIKTIVFEEADRTLDMGFQGSVNEILEEIEKKLDFYQVQKVLVSAHFNEKVEGLIKNLDMDRPQYIGFERKQQAH
jgi:ATP-dependent RNA helicase DDX31/DBP7